MSDVNDKETGIEDLDEAFDLLETPPKVQAALEALRKDDKNWKFTDPEAYKKDMEAMCKSMFGERWQTEYEAMLKEEFPEEYR